MAFMVPVVKNNWDLYGTGSGQSSRRSSQQTRSAPQSRRTSQASGGMSRQTSASSSGSAPTTSGFIMQGPSFSSSRCPPGRVSQSGAGSRRVSGTGSSASGGSTSPPRSVTFGPPNPPSARKAASPPSASKAAGRQAEKHTFHTKVVDKLMRVLHRGEKEGAGRA